MCSACGSYRSSSPAACGRGDDPLAREGRDPPQPRRRRSSARSTTRRRSARPSRRSGHSSSCTSSPICPTTRRASRRPTTPTRGCGARARASSWPRQALLERRGSSRRAWPGSSQAPGARRRRSSSGRCSAPEGSSCVRAVLRSRHVPREAARASPVQIDDAARRTVALLDAPSGIVDVVEDEGWAARIQEGRCSRAGGRRRRCETPRASINSGRPWDWRSSAASTNAAAGRARRGAGRASPGGL